MSLLRSSINQSLVFSKINPSGYIFILLCICFAAVASLQSLTQHYQYYTSTWDLGFHNQLMYKFTHFKSPGTTLWNPDYPLTCFLGDHVTLLMPINSQLYWIFGSYAMLVVQILYCIIGALGLYKLIVLKTRCERLGLTGVLLFFTHYTLYAAIDFDAHDNVYGVMFLPWILYFYYKDNFRYFLISLGIFLLAREDLALVAIMLGVCFLLFDWKKTFRYSLSCIAISTVYFLIAYKVLIPYFSPLPEGKFAAWRFGAVGASISEVIMNSLANPGKILYIMLDAPEKQDKLKYFLYTGGIFFIFRPKYFLLVVPVFFINSLSSSWSQWGNMCHYNILFAILLPYVVISVTEMIRLPILTNLFLVFMVFMNAHYLDKNFFLDWRRFDRIFTSEFYHLRPNQKEITEGLKLIPPDASVSATTYLTPHLAFRDKVYYFPDVKDAGYIAINEDDTKTNFYPFESPEKFEEAINLLKNNKDFNVLYQRSGMLVLKRN